MRGHWGWFLLIAALILTRISLQEKPKPPQAVQFLPSVTQTEPIPTTQPALELPCVVRGSELIIEKTVSYEGDFWEDGTYEYAADIMALVVYNPGLSGIRSAELSVRQGQRQLCFYITYLPPGERVLVLERFRNAYSREDLTQCRCTALEKVAWENAAVSAEPAGDRSLLLKNRTGTPLSAVTLHYKQYDSGSEMYLGGMTHQLTVAPLDAGAQLQVYPQYYAATSSRVVLVEAEGGT